MYSILYGFHLFKLVVACFVLFCFVRDETVDVFCVQTVISRDFQPVKTAVQLIIKFLIFLCIERIVHLS